MPSKNALSLPQKGPDFTFDSGPARKRPILVYLTPFILIGGSFAGWGVYGRAQHAAFEHMLDQIVRTLNEGHVDAMCYGSRNGNDVLIATSCDNGGAWRYTDRASETIFTYENGAYTVQTGDGEPESFALFQPSSSTMAAQVANLLALQRDKILARGPAALEGHPKDQIKKLIVADKGYRYIMLIDTAATRVVQVQSERSSASGFTVAASRVTFTYPDHADGSHVEASVSRRLPVPMMGRMPQQGLGGRSGPLAYTVGPAEFGAIALVGKVAGGEPHVYARGSNGVLYQVTVLGNFAPPEASQETWFSAQLRPLSDPPHPPDSLLLLTKPSHQGGELVEVPVEQRPARSALWRGTGFSPAPLTPSELARERAMLALIRAAFTSGSDPRIKSALPGEDAVAAGSRPNISDAYRQVDWYSLYPEVAVQLQGIENVDRTSRR
jgi:hypothetical protein